MLRGYLDHVRNCLTVRRLLRGADSPNLRNLYWYDLRLVDAVCWRGILAVLWWNLFRREDDEIAGNYRLRNLYFAEPRSDGLHGPAGAVWHCAGLETKPWFDGQNAICKALEEAAPAIVAEYRGLAAELDTHPDNASLTDGGRWTGMFLYQASGKRNEALCARCPETVRVIESLPLCKNFGFVMFSGVEPHTHIEPHTGSSNLRMRCHLGVDVPEPDRARLRVGTEWRSWTQGRAFAFDDAFQHEVVHEGERDRVVLVVDVWHPGLGARDIEVLSHPVFQRFGKVAQ